MAGRFLNEDPIRSGMNWYVYCGGNPVSYWDPSGLVRQFFESYGPNGENYTVNTAGFNEWNSGFSGSSSSTGKEESIARAIEEALATTELFRILWEWSGDIKAETDTNLVLSGGPMGKTLDVSPMRQIGNTCVTTSAAMIDKFYNPDSYMSRDEITKAISKKYKVDVYENGTWVMDIDGIIGFKITPSDPNRLDFDGIASEIRNGNPVLVELLTNNGGHAIVITGFVTTSETKGIIYNDPGNGGRYYIPYSLFSPDFYGDQPGFLNRTFITRNE